MKHVWSQIGTFIILISATIIELETEAFANKDAIAKPSNGYVFPVRPGTPEWMELESHDDMLLVCQIPDNILADMSTADLIETIINYPLYSDIFAYSSFQNGFESVVSRFNGFMELLVRDDVGAEILARYRSMDPALAGRMPTILEQGRYDLLMTYVEIILAQDDILLKLTQQERESLRIEALAKTSSKLLHSQIYGQFGLERTALILGRLAVWESTDFKERADRNPILKDFLTDGSHANEMSLKEIYDYHKNITPMDNSTYVYTPKGTAVSAYLKTYELTSSQIAILNADVERQYPLAIRETNSSRKYNCHSYAWHNQLSNNNIWINTPGDDKYWEDGSYSFITFGSGNSIPAGVPDLARVSYALDDHSAIKMTSTHFRSKWGSWPQMTHLPAYSPYNSSRLNYYKSNAPKAGFPSCTAYVNACRCSGSATEGTPPYTYYWKAGSNAWQEGGQDFTYYTTNTVTVYFKVRDSAGIWSQALYDICSYGPQP